MAMPVATACRAHHRRAAAAEVEVVHVLGVSGGIFVSATTTPQGGTKGTKLFLYRPDSRKRRSCICFRRRDITSLFYSRGGNLESNLRYFGRTGGTKYFLARDAARTAPPPHSLTQLAAPAARW
jgi:hypothetical protein